MNEVSFNRAAGILIQDQARSGLFNMAADSYAASWAKRVDAPVLRLYTWNCATLSLGFHQKISDTIRDKCTAAKVPIVRRPTGGRAVLHDNELTYCLCLPTDHELFKAARDDLLRQIGEIFVLAASKCGLDADQVRVSGREMPVGEPLKKGSPLCFDSVSRWEVRLNGRKWIGSAQRFLPGVLLQHGSIILGRNSIDLATLFGLKRSAEETTDWTDDQIDIDLLRVEIPKSFSANWNIDWETRILDQSLATEISDSVDSFQVINGDDEVK
ncbi:MAG: hypothetical protein ABIE92_03390 [bacterium]